MYINPAKLSSSPSDTAKTNNSCNNCNSSSNMYVNPNFLNNTSSAKPIKTANKVEQSVQAHINPNFLNRSRNVSEPDSNGRIHINPNFVGRSLPLPPTSSTSFSGLPMLNQGGTIEKTTSKVDLTQSTRPHINPKFVDTLKAKAYDDAVKKAVMNNEYALKNHTTELDKRRNHIRGFS